MPDNYVQDGVVYPDQLSATMLNHPGIPEDLRSEFKQALDGPEKPADALKSEEGTPPTTRIVVHPEAPQRDIESNYLEKLTGTPNPRPVLDIIKDFVGEQFDKFKGALTAPGDAWLGKLDPSSPQGIERAFNLAGLMVGGPAPVAAKAADGTLGSFMGVRSKTINKTELYKAQEMEMNGVHPDEIWSETGTFRGADGRWRQEIDDSKATLNNKAFDHTITPAVGGSDGMGQGGWGSGGGLEALHTVSLKSKPTDFFGAKKPVMLDQVLNHPELFQAYPHLKQIKVEPLPAYLRDKNILGQMSSDGTLSLTNDLHPDFARSVILHEVQHDIQNMEGFAMGGNAQNFLPRELPKAKEDFIKARDETMAKMEIKDAGLWKKVVRAEMDGIVPPRLVDQLEILKLKHPEDYKRMVNIVKSEKLIEEAEIEAHTSYKRLMGEVEARNVQTRMMFNKLSRKTSPPKSTEDVPRFRQLGNEGEYGPLR
jgi:hypothetical protein